MDASSALEIEKTDKARQEDDIPELVVLFRQQKDPTTMSKTAPQLASMFYVKTATLP